MAYSETTSTSWFSRIGGSFKGIGLGLILFIAATCLIYWNEGRTVRTGGAINEAQRVCVDMKDINKVAPSLEGKVVYATGKADTQQVLEDNVFGVKTPGPAIRLSRSVLYYQWVESSKTEKKKKYGGGEETVTTYTYKKEWVSRPVDSSEFHDPDYRDRNTVITTLDSDNDSVTATDVTFGAYILPNFLKSSMGGAAQFAPKLTEEQLKTINKQIRGRTSMAMSGQQSMAGIQRDAQGRRRTVAVSNNAIISNAHINGNTLYLGSDFGMPEIGDMKVSFYHTPPATISIIAKVIGPTFETFRASNGATFSRLSMGTVSSENMFGDARSSNSTMAWIMRVVGIVLTIAAISALLGPLSVLASVIPFLGDVVGAGTGFVATLVGLAWALIVIAVSWIRFRPVLAFALIGVAVVAIVLVIFKGHKNKKPVPAPTATEK